MPKQPKNPRRDENRRVTARAEPNDESADLNKMIAAKLDDLKEKRGINIFPLLLGDTLIDHETVDDVYDELCSRFQPSNERLEVIVNSSGGNLHAAYNLALLFRRFATKELNFIVPRWAKSAATLLVCAGNKILMGEVSELGPIDPQITQMNPLERRLEEFSPLHIEATLELIRNEFKDGHKQLADGLLQRLQFPLTLGGFKKSLEISKQYLTRLLTTRMLSGTDATKQAEDIAKSLVEAYADHGFCIDIDEAGAIGLKVEHVSPDHWSLIWDIHKLEKQRDELELREKQKHMEDLLRQLPPDLLKSLPTPQPDNKRISVPTAAATSKRGIAEMTETTTLGDVQKKTLAIAIASAILRKNGEIAVDDIKAIPFLTSRHDVDAVIDYLLRHYNTELSQRRVESKPILRWEQFIRLKDM